MSERKACSLASLSRSQFRYQSRKRENPELIKAILEIKEKHPYFGQPRVLSSLRRKGYLVNGKRVFRILKTLHLTVKKRRKKQTYFVPPSRELPLAISVGDVWSIDFVSDNFLDGSKFRCLTIVDNLSRQVPGIYAMKSMAGYSPVDYFEKLKAKVKLPKHIILDNGPEFANSVFVSWCMKNQISLHFIDPGKPVQNAYIESFNGKFREEFLSQNKFKNIFHLRKEIEDWIKFYNEERPHSSLDYLTPKEFAIQENCVLNRSQLIKKNSLVLKTG